MPLSWIEPVNTQRGKKYRVRYRDETGRKMSMTPLCTTYAIALEVAKEIDRKIQLGAFGLIDGRQTIGDLYTAFMERPIRPRREATQRHLREHLKLLPRDIPLARFSEASAQEYKMGLISKYSPNGINIKLRAARWMFNYAVNKDMIRKNPFTNIPFEPEEDVSRALTIKEARAMMKKLDPPARKIFMLFCLTGVRCGEMVKLLNRSEGVRIENGGIAIDRLRSKNRKPKFIPLRREVMPTIREIEAGKYVGWNEWMLRGRIIRKLKSTTRLRLHDLRHTAITWLLQAGWTLPEAGSFAGHTSPKMTDRYKHLERSYLVRKINRGAVFGAKG